MNKRLLLFCSFILISFSNTYAIPAYPKKVPVIIGGDTIYISIHGDENCKYGSDEDGYTLLQSDKGWHYASVDSLGNVSFSDYFLTASHKHTDKTIEFLKSTPKGLIPNECVKINKINDANYSKSDKEPAIGSRKALVILMQFQDTKFSKSPEDFRCLFNEPDYHEDGAIGSVYDYYKWASYGQLNLNSDILGPYTANNNMSYYGRNEGVSGNDKNPYELFLEALDYAANEVNLKEYDSDGDGHVDNIHIIYAGYGEEAGASSNAIWAHEMTFRTITVQGMKIDRYSCAPELRGNMGNGISRIGPHCHEIGHALGAMDFYDTDYDTGGKYIGTGKWDIMASGSWNNDGITPADFNPYVKIYNFGWTSAQSLNPNTINTIGTSTEKGNIFRVNTGVSNDFFLLELRDRSLFHSSEPGEGLLIFHIGPNLESRSFSNTINTTFPQQCYVVCASSEYQQPSSFVNSYGNINSEGCPFPGSLGKMTFDDESTPSARTISGQKTGISISNIHYDCSNIAFLFNNINNDNPEDPQPDPEVSYIWAEDFEQLKLPASWEYKDILGSGKFDVRTKLSTNNNPESPTAASGLGYASFTAVPQMIIGEYRTTGNVCSRRIRLADKGGYTLSISARKYNGKKKDSNDSIMVTLVDEEEGMEFIIIKEKINNQDVWKTLSVPLPNEYNDFSMIITCNIDYGSTLFIDNINISEHETSKIDNAISASSILIKGNELYISKKKGVSLNIYSLNGICIYSLSSKDDRSEYVTLTKGCYVIRQSDGTKKKIIMK